MVIDLGRDFKKFPFIYAHEAGQEQVKYASILLMGDGPGCLTCCDTPGETGVLTI
ncbi:hypothetical protein DAQ1742_03998 [Dickeya aquatica]|uniref:Uncharacterized protein n=1 Tax=Dickeya aquatica TaxID=1401087 RepID=A0A375AFA9_9GAMM|nr:hypothetical protein DAQ1742_03998 [Dickeya aquatica]